MKFAVVTLGSAGDLHPFLAIARELVRRGHDVRLLSQAPYESQSLAEGVPFIPVVDTAAHERTLKHPLLWHPVNGFGVLWRHLAVPAIEPTCEVLGQLAHGGEKNERLTVFASPLAAGARFARERWPDRIRLVCGYTAPMGLRSVEDPMFLGGWKVPGWVPTFARAPLWRLLDRWKLEPMARPLLERWQSQWGVSAIQTSIFGDWLHSPDGGIALYPPSYAEVPSTWRARGVSQVGFPLFEPQDLAPLSEATVRFQQQDRRYVLIYPGSAAGSAEHFIHLVVPACRRLGLPCIVLSPHLHQTALSVVPDAEDLLILDQAPLRPLLSGALLFVHHGGIGSLAQALNQSVRQLVLASAYDQFENGCRITGLDAGDWMPLSHARSSDVERLIGRAVAARERRGTVDRSKFNSADSGRAAVSSACDHLEAVSHA
jgi:rhamnosyltransferase subunit B